MPRTLNQYGLARCGLRSPEQFVHADLCNQVLARIVGRIDALEVDTGFASGIDMGH
ncbi:hypothetical protein [Rhodococcoides kyotonense]|uniref:hypothetical protein n=1 Tax=Rhodococcoides kyotonense TaxID=398843 RepID=UPI001FE52034|nr:hypothetical protein [Rhodococcus kyotonensis]